MASDDHEKAIDGEITATMELFDASELAELHRTTVSLVTALDFREVMRLLVEGAIKALDGDFAYFLIRSHSGELTIASHLGLSKLKAHDPTARKVFTENTSVLILSGPELEDSLAGSSPCPSSLVYCPLDTTKGVIGVVCVGSYRKRFEIKETRALTLLTRPAGLVFENALLYERSTVLGKQLRALADVQRVLSTVSLDRAFPTFVLALREVVTFDLALLLSYQPHHQEYLISHAWSSKPGRGQPWTQRRVPTVRSLHARAIARGPGQIVKDLERHGQGDEYSWLLEEGVSSGVVISLSSFDTIIGAFSVWSSESDVYSEPERQFVSELGQPLVLAVKSHRLFTQLERAKSDWESTFDAMNDAVWIADAGQRIHRYNSAFRRAVAVDHATITAESAPALLDADPDALQFQPGDEVREGKLRRELTGTKLGGIIEVIATRIPREEEGRAVYVARDVTEAKTMNARLQQASRLASIGQLAAALAHEINNPLAYISANLHSIHDGTGKAEVSLLLRENSDEGATPAVDETLTKILRELPVLVGESLEGVSRVQRIIEKLQIYAQGDTQEVTTFSLNELVEFCLTVVWATLRRCAHVEKEFKELPLYHGAQHRLSQVLVNVLVSAARSMDPFTLEKNNISIKTSYDGEYYRVRLAAVRDGRPVPILEDGSFEPNRVSADSDEPIELWLEPDFSIIRELGGSVEVEAGAPPPTALTLVLPRHPSVSVASTKQVTLPGVKALSGRVLIVDDEPYVRRALKRVLASRHDVTLARDGFQAIELLESADSSFDVILCDVVMPRMTGLEFYKLLCERWPDLRNAVVFVTGGVFSVEAETALGSCPNPVLKKPVQPPALVAAVDRVLAKRALGRG